MAPQAPFMFNYLTGGAIALCRLARFEEAANMAESTTLVAQLIAKPQRHVF
jgi:hypothetical protein